MWDESFDINGRGYRVIVVIHDFYEKELSESPDGRYLFFFKFRQHIRWLTLLKSEREHQNHSNTVEWLSFLWNADKSFRAHQPTSNGHMKTNMTSICTGFSLIYLHHQRLFDIEWRDLKGFSFTLTNEKELLTRWNDFYLDKMRDFQTVFASSLLCVHFRIYTIKTLIFHMDKKRITQVKKRTYSPWWINTVDKPSVFLFDFVILSIYDR